MNNQKQLIKATLVFSILSILQPASNFLLLPVYTKYLSVQQYGYFSILNNVSYFFTIISGLNIVTAIVAFYKSYKEHNSLRKFVGDVITFCIYFNILLLIVLALFGDRFSGLLFKEKILYFPDVFYAVSFGLISNIILAHFNFLKYERKLKEFAVLTILQFIAFISLQYLFIVIFKDNIRGALQARLLAVSIIMVIVLFLNRRYVFRVIDYKKNILPQLKYSIVTGPAVLIGWLSAYADRFIIEHRSSNTEMLGQYSFLATICAVAELGVYAYNSAVQPFVFDSYVNKENNAVSNYYKLFTAAVIFTVSSLILAGSNLHFFVHNQAYKDILQMVPLMSVGYVFFGVSSIYSLQTTYARKSWYYLFTYMGALLINIILNLLLINRFGITGIITASFFTKVFLACLMIFFAQRSHRTYGLKNILLMACAFTAVVLVCWFLSFSNFISLQLGVVIQFLLSIVIILLSIKPKLVKDFLLRRNKTNPANDI